MTGQTRTLLTGPLDYSRTYAIATPCPYQNARRHRLSSLVPSSRRPERADSWAACTNGVPQRARAFLETRPVLQATQPSITTTTTASHGGGKRRWCMMQRSSSVAKKTRLVPSLTLRSKVKAIIAVLRRPDSVCELMFVANAHSVRLSVPRSSKGGHDAEVGKGFCLRCVTV